jgi:hypothetical protein
MAVCAGNLPRGGLGSAGDAEDTARGQNPMTEPAKLLLLASLLANDRIITNNGKAFLKGARAGQGGRRRAPTCLTLSAPVASRVASVSLPPGHMDKGTLFKHQNRVPAVVIMPFYIPERRDRCD